MIVPTIDQGDVEPCHDNEEDKYVHKYKFVLGSNSVLTYSFVVTCTLCYAFLGPRGPLVLPPGGPVRTPALKILTPIYRHICLMSHESSGDSSNQPDGPMGSPKRLP